jgi:hypothetical protein
VETVTLIQYICRNPEHQTLAHQDPMDDPSVNPITVYGKEWAFCPSGARAEHQWAPTGGMSVDELRNSLRITERTQRS